MLPALLGAAGLALALPSVVGEAGKIADKAFFARRRSQKAVDLASRESMRGGIDDFLRELDVKGEQDFINLLGKRRAVLPPGGLPAQNENAERMFLSSLYAKNQDMLNSIATKWQRPDDSHFLSRIYAEMD